MFPFQYLILLAALTATALAQGGGGGHGKGYHKEPEYGPAKYAYKYGVKDDHYGYPVDFGAEENRDGYKTSGSYYVYLPDGRRQVVTYYVEDAYSGYVADVKYEGKATYGHPEPHKGYGKGHA